SRDKACRVSTTDTWHGTRHGYRNGYQTRVHVRVRGTRAGQGYSCATFTVTGCALQVAAPHPTGKADHP
ncbi:MAG TPA: hypothetical protein VF490_12980, partial [Chryseosolibacter sp.]